MDEDEKPAAGVHNENKGPATNLVQAREVHGGISFRVRTWLVAVSVIVAAVVVSTAIVVTRGSSVAGAPTAARPVNSVPAGTAPTTGLAGFRVTADLSYDDQPPWGYVSADPTFPGAAMISTLSHPGAAYQPGVAPALRATGAARLDTQLIRLHFEGPPNADVRVTDIQPVIESKAPPLSGSLVWAVPQGEENSSETQLDLDAAYPVLQQVKLNEAAPATVLGPFFPAKTIDLHDGETSDLVVTAVAAKASYRYSLVVSYETGDTIRKVTVDDAGRPFQVTGFNCTGPDLGSYAAAYIVNGSMAFPPDPDPRHLSRQTSC